jgi:hypothetical protein
MERSYKAPSGSPGHIDGRDPVNAATPAWLDLKL